MPLSLVSFAAILQVEPSPLNSRALQAVLITGLFLAVVIAMMVLIFRYLRMQRESSGTAKLREEFEKSKDILLARAQARRQQSEKEAGSERELSAEERERELLKENVDPTAVFGNNCPLCNLELAEDEDLIIDPYSGTSCHLSCFLNAWPLDQDGKPLERPKFIYRYPDATVVKSSDLIRSF